MGRSCARSAVAQSRAPSATRMITGASCAERGARMYERERTPDSAGAETRDGRTAQKQRTAHEAKPQRAMGRSGVRANDGGVTHAILYRRARAIIVTSP